MARESVEVVMVDDNVGDARLTQEVVKGLPGLTIALRHFGNGRDALSHFNDIEQEPETLKPPSLILLDLNLPGTTGFEVLEHLKGSSMARVPVVVLTTSISHIDIHTAYDLRANSYVVKPVDLDRFREVISDMMIYWLQTAKLPEP